MFEGILAEAAKKYPVEVLAYTLMPDHWHLIVRPAKKDALAKFMLWMGVKHVRQHPLNRTKLSKRVYSGRYKSFAIEAGQPFLDVAAFIESNALRKGLVKQAQKWRWSSLSARESGKPKVRMASWPVKMPRNWVERVNTPLDKAQTTRLVTSVQRGRPYGEPAFMRSAATKHGLQHTLNPIGRPRKVVADKPTKAKKSAKKR